MVNFDGGEGSHCLIWEEACILIMRMMRMIYWMYLTSPVVDTRGLSALTFCLSGLTQSTLHDHHDHHHDGDHDHDHDGDDHDHDGPHCHGVDQNVQMSNDEDEDNDDGQCVGAEATLSGNDKVPHNTSHNEW